jgi:hypothetical protein
MYNVCEIFTAALTESSIFRDITPYISLKVDRRFGGAFRLHRGRKVSQAGKKPDLFFEHETQENYSPETLVHCRGTILRTMTLPSSCLVYRDLF